MVSSSDILGAVTEWLSQESLSMLMALLGHYQPTIVLVTAVLTFIIATIPLILYREVLSEESWVLYIGWAFMVNSFQYTISSLSMWLSTFAWVEHSLLVSVTYLAHSLGSPINSVLFLAAARSLLNKARAIPMWAVFAAIGSVLSSIVAPLSGFPSTWWSRLPDGILASFSLLALGWAFFTNIDPQWNRIRPRVNLTEINLATYGFRWRKLFFALIALQVTWLYAALNLLLVAGPLLAQRSWSLSELRVDAPQAYDTFFLALANPLKICLIIPVLYLILRNLVILSPRAMRETLRQVTVGRLTFYSNEGIVKTIARSLDADLVQLYSINPGNLQRKKAVLWLYWQPEQDHAARVKNPLLTPFPPETTIAGVVLRTGEALYRSHLDPGDLRWDEPREGDHEILDPGIRSAIGIPILHHGSVIAGLSIGWKHANVVTSTVIQHTKLIGDQLAPLVKGRIELASLLQLSHWFQRQDVNEPDNGHGSLLRLHTQVIFSTLSPGAVAIALDAGFLPVVALRSEQQDSEVEIVRQGKARDHCERRLATLYTGTQTQSTFSEPLTIEGVKVGELFFLEPAPASRLQRPNLAGEWPLRQIVANMLADAVFDSVRVWLSSQLNRLQTRLANQGTTSMSAWFRELEEAARIVGIEWVVAKPQEGNTILGNGRAVAFVEDLLRDETREEQKAGAWLTHVQLAEAYEEVHCVVSVQLSQGGSLYFGIRRQGFGIELTENWPWRVYLERLADAASASLARMEISRLREDELNKHGLMTASILTGSLIHQLGNLAANLGADLYGLRELSRAEADRFGESFVRKIESMSGVVQQLAQVTNAIGDVTNLDRSRPCLVADAVQSSLQLFGPQLERKNVDFTSSIPPGLRANVPGYVLALAISNLLSNSLYAIQKANNPEGKIQILVEDLGGIIHCRVIDNGPGVDPEVRHKIFDLNVSTKPRSNGLGLYLARRSLRENGGDLVLSADSRSGHTEFTIILPKG